MNPFVLAAIEGAVGFAIGAGTNDLAIRWIFHTVFAKKKRAIAEAVQRVISNELMTPEKVAHRLAEPSAQGALKSSVLPLADEALAAFGEAFAEVLLAGEGRHRFGETIAEGLAEMISAFPTPMAVAGPKNAAACAQMVASRSDFLVEEFARLIAMPDAQTLLLEALVKAVKRRLAAYGMLGAFITTAVGFGPIEDRLAGFCRTVPDSLREQFADVEERRRLEQAAEEALVALMRRNWTDLTDFGNRAKVSCNVASLLADKASATTLSRIVACWATALLQTVRRIPIGRLDRFFGPELRHSLAALCAAECGAFARDRTADLMRELEKVVSVVRKRANLPVKLVLVIDATTGQNGLQQAREFNSALELDGVVITKLDGTAKGGIAVAVAHYLKLPIVKLGVGEGLEDLKDFDAHDYAAGLVGDFGQE